MMIQFDKVKGSIHCAHIYAAEKEANGIDRFYYKIQNQLKKEYSEIEMEAHIKRMQSVLGYNDELIQIIDLPWELFLSFYKDNTGILNHSSEEYQQFAACITTIIGLEQEEGNQELCNNDDPLPKIEDKASPYEFCMYLDTIVQEISKCNTKSRILHKNLVLSLNNLVNSFAKFFDIHISENLFFPSICAEFCTFRQAVYPSDGI